MFTQLNYQEAEKFMKDGFHIQRASWEPCRKIRSPQDSDIDYVSFDLNGLVIEDCKKNCDCKISIWRRTKEDIEATDWQVNYPPIANADELASGATLDL